MKIFKSLFVLSALTVAVVLISCGKDDGDTPKTAKEITLEALEGSWSLDASSDLNNSGVDASSVTVDVSSTGFTVTGLESYVTKGTFTVSEEGTLTDPSVTIAGDLQLKGDPTISMSSNKITVNFETEAKSGGRVAGVGAWTLIFVKAS